MFMIKKDEVANENLNIRSFFCDTIYKLVSTKNIRACENVEATVLLSTATRSFPLRICHSSEPPDRSPPAGFQKWLELDEVVALAATRPRPPSRTQICILLHSSVCVYSGHPLPLRDDLSLSLVI